MAYLRAYEPLAVFGNPPPAALLKAVETAELTRANAGEREQRMWLKSQVAAPVRLLPAELADGRPAPSTRTDVLVLQPDDVPGGESLGSGPLICPLELRARSAAALVSFLSDATPPLRDTVLTTSGVTDDSLRSRATAALSDLRHSVMHVLSTTWTVPLPWFALIDPEDRRLVLGSGPNDPDRELSWRVPLTVARDRALEAQSLVESIFGDAGPAQILDDTVRWLDNFDSGSVIELDYGGLVQLISDPILETDTSAEEVHSIIDALRTGEPGELAELFNDLRDYWAELAGRERFN